MRWNDSRGLRVRQFWCEQLPSTPTLMLHCSWNTTGNCSKCSRQVFVQGRWRLVNMFSMCRWFKMLLILQYAVGTTPRTYFSYSCLYVCQNTINCCECPSAASSIAICFNIFMIVGSLVKSLPLAISSTMELEQVSAGLSQRCHLAKPCWEPAPCEVFNHGVGTDVHGIVPTMLPRKALLRACPLPDLQPWSWNRLTCKRITWWRPKSIIAIPTRQQWISARF